MPLATDRFRRQHTELAELAGALQKQLAAPPSQLRSEGALHALAQLAGKLKMHAAMENEALYPRLLQHEDSKVRAVAHRFETDFGGVYDQFLRFRARWATAEAIALAPQDFVDEAEDALAHLGERIKRENAELYEMVDGLYPAAD